MALVLEIIAVVFVGAILIEGVILLASKKF